MFSFIMHFIVFAVGDASLYFLTNTLYEHFLKRRGVYPKVRLLTPQEWVAGNTVSYTLLYFIYTQQTGLLYFDIDRYGIFYASLSPILYFHLQDLLFYMAHRLAHTSFFYKRIHYEHHRYRSPTNWVSRLSHWVDSNLENVAFIVPAIVIPMNVYIWFACLIFTYMWGNFLHDSTRKVRITLLNDNTDHALHHYYGEKNFNFAFYFNHWDKYFGTYKKLYLNTDIP